MSNKQCGESYINLLRQMGEEILVEPNFNYDQPFINLKTSGPEIVEGIHIGREACLKAKEETNKIGDVVFGKILPRVDAQKEYDRNLRKRIAEYASNLTGAMSDADTHEYRMNSKQRIMDSPGVTFPNCREFRISIGPWDKDLMPFGILKREKPVLSFKKYKNHRFNRYLTHQIIRLKKARTANAKLYGTIGGLLIKRSNIFRAAAFQHVIPNGHRNFPYEFILNVNRKVSKIINENKRKLDYSRVYIPKDNGKGRGLGVPKMEGRIILHMLQNLITYYVQPKLLRSQHGFVPGKGTLTAGKEIFNKNIIDKDYILEFDLKECFPSIIVTSTIKKLGDMGVPAKICDLLEDINECAIELPPIHLRDERAELKKKAIEMLQDFDNTHKDKLIDPDMHRRSGSDEDSRIKNMPFMVEGLPQGAATSPILTITALSDFFLRQKPSISYADDGLFYSDEPFNNRLKWELTPKQQRIKELCEKKLMKCPAGLKEYNERLEEENYMGIIEDPYFGAYLNKEKTQGVKYAGKGIRPLKFLGLEYDGKTNLFKAKTRRGSNVYPSTEILAAAELKARMEANELTGTKLGSLENPTCGKIMFKSTLAGGIQSRMYQGSFDKETVIQDFTFKYENKSGCGQTFKKKPTIKLNLYNSSSYAVRSLINQFRGNQKIRKPRLAMDIHTKRRRKALARPEIEFLPGPNPNAVMTEETNSGNSLKIALGLIAYIIVSLCFLGISLLDIQFNAPDLRWDEEDEPSDDKVTLDGDPSLSLTGEELEEVARRTLKPIEIVNAEGEPQTKGGGMTLGASLLSLIVLAGIYLNAIEPSYLETSMQELNNIHPGLDVIPDERYISGFAIEHATEVVAPVLIKSPEIMHGGHGG